MGTPDDQIGAAIDVSGFTDAKFDALAAHHSQISDSFWMKMGREQFNQVMRTEYFVRARDPHHRTDLVTDLFADYR